MRLSVHFHFTNHYSELKRSLQERRDEEFLSLLFAGGCVSNGQYFLVSQQHESTLRGEGEGEGRREGGGQPGSQAPVHFGELKYNFVSSDYSNRLQTGQRLMNGYCAHVTNPCEAHTHWPTTALDYRCLIVVTRIRLLQVRRV